ncbi:MAG: PRC-barrel domain-containing protein [Patescibacteria group bacterium]|nr:PRC-barrel domain-containing protein [Patescibacteria group bacterium]
MSIKAKEIINKRVINRSGCYLGRVIDFDINALTQVIIRYYVQGNLLGFFKSPLIINASQVIKIEKDRIIVEDAIIRKRVIKKKTGSSMEYAK